MRSALLLFLLPGVTAVDNAVCKVLSPGIAALDSVDGLECSCVSDGTALNMGGDAKCHLEIGPPPGVEALAAMKIKLDLGTTIQPCAMPATASLEGGIVLPQLSGSPDTILDEMVAAAITELDAKSQADITYGKSDNKITVSMSVEAGTEKHVELPIQKYAVADFFIKLSLKVEGNAAALKTTQSVDLCMKTPEYKAGGFGVDAIEICGAKIPQCGVKDYPIPYPHKLADDLVVTAQGIICKATPKVNWHKMFQSPPIQFAPSQEFTFTDACRTASSGSAPPPPPTVTLAMQASGSISDYSDTSDLKQRIGVAACSLQAGKRRDDGGDGTIQDCWPGSEYGMKGLIEYDSAIAVTITAASVIITAVITASSNSAAAELADSLTAKLSTAEAASEEFGITIETIPTVVVYSPASGSSPDNGGAIAGGLISAILFIGTIATVVYLVKKERIANPIDRLKEKLGKKQVHVAPEKNEHGAAELTAASP